VGEIVTPVGSFPAAPASADAPTVLLWVVTVLVVLLGMACLLLWQRIQREAANCSEQNAQAREDAARARTEAKAEADSARDKIEALYRQAIDQFAERETRLVGVVQANTEALNEIKEIGSGYYRTLREQRDNGSHAPERRSSPHDRG
jgi:hypothetical protein